MAYVVKVELDSFQSCDINETFSVCGEIRGIYSYNSAEPGQNTVFIDFAQYESLERALSLHLDVSGIRVFTSSMVPLFEEEYRVANPTAFEPLAMILDRSRSCLQNTSEAHPHSAHSNDPWLTSDTWQGPARDDFSPVSSPNAKSFNNPFISSSTGYPVDVLNEVSDVPISYPSDSAHDDLSQSIELAETTAETISLSSTLVDIPSILISSPSDSPLVHLDSSKSASSMTVPCLPLTTRIHMSLCGEIFAYDLDCLQSDPREIVELLKTTGSERGNWMMVGAYYRRKGNPRAAIAVITAMLEVMHKYQVPERDLKPAFLLLSSCETDLGKSLKVEGKENACEHYRNSQMWLQKVYGTMPTAPSDTAARSSYRSDAKLHKPSDIPPQMSSLSSPLSDRSTHRKVQDLRKRLHQQADLLADTRYSKRKLEDECDTERKIRRRLEKQIDDLRRQLDNARKNSAHTSKQMDRELEDRKKATAREETKVAFGKHYRPPLYIRSPSSNHGRT